MSPKFTVNGRMTALAACFALVCGASLASAQCSSCGTPTVAYAPATAIVAPTVVAYDGWYPGRMLDRWRLRRWSAPVAAPAYTAAYAPYTAAYAPYTAAYAPAVTSTAWTAAYAPYTAAYTPYVSAYAPLQSAVVQTSYMPVASHESCSSCAQTVYRPAELSPVVADLGCTACAAPACSGCSACSYDSSAAVTVAAPPAGCASCAAEAGQIISSGPAGAAVPSNLNTGREQTPQPGLGVDEPIPDASQYDTNRPPATSSDAGTPSGSGAVDPGPAPEETNTDSSTYFDAPHLLQPGNDRTAHRPTVDVHHAVYRQPARATKASVTTVAKPVSAPSQAELDAEGWASVAQ
jgi:hypothetical protein